MRMLDDNTTTTVMTARAMRLANSDRGALHLSPNATTPWLPSMHLLDIGSELRGYAPISEGATTP